MERINRKLFVLMLMAMLSLAGNAQVYDTLDKSDIIIRVDGDIIYGKVLEVSQENVKYRISDIKNGPVITLPRNLVYAISYSNNSTQIISPTFGKSKVEQTPFDQQKPDNETSEEEQGTNWKDNMAHGTVKIGMGFSREYTSFAGVEDFNKVASAPSLVAAYQFRYNKYLITGANLGYASFKYDYNKFSDYDQIDISQDINELIVTLGVYGRYNIMNGFIKPYLLLGLNINYVYATIDGDIFFREELKHITTSSVARGFKTDIVGRAGLDILFGKKFGVYSDIGTGTSLLQVGAAFNL